MSQGRRLDAVTRKQILRLSCEFSRRVTARLLRISPTTVCKVLRQARLEANQRGVHNGPGTL